jgi:hypothetical protein
MALRAAALQAVMVAVASASTGAGRDGGGSGGGGGGSSPTAAEAAAAASEAVRRHAPALAAAAAAVLSDAVPLSVGGAGPQARLAAARLATALLAGDDLTLSALEVTTTTTQTLNPKS